MRRKKHRVVFIVHFLLAYHIVKSTIVKTVKIYSTLLKKKQNVMINLMYVEVLKQANNQIKKKKKACLPC